MDNSSPDSVCAAFSERSEKITIRTVDDGQVLIEGDAAALEFLGNLLIAQARFRKDCGFQISPSGPGSAVFSQSSNVGIFIHRLPCAHGGADAHAA